MDEKNVNSWTLSSVMKPAIIPLEMAAEVRLRQLASIYNLFSIILLGSVISLWAVLLTFWQTGYQNLLAIWAGANVIACAAMTINYVRSRHRAIKPGESAGRISAMSRMALLLGVLWGLAPVIVIPAADPMGQMALGIILVGLMFSGAILLGRIPQAGFSFVVPLAMLFVLSLQFNYHPLNGYLSVLTIFYIAILAVIIRWTHSQFVNQIVNAEAVKHQSQLIGLLLRDFEESTSDWLWQTDEDGLLTEIPLSLGAGKSEYEAMCRGQHIHEVFRETSALKVLRTCLDRHKDFRDLVLQVQNEDKEIWWSLTGKPVYENGFFAGFRGVASDVTQSKETEDRIAYMAHYDDLTGLPNRAMFHEALEKIVRRPNDPKIQRAIVWLDLDKFKWVNDTLGHPAGDELLGVVASRIMRVAETDDVVARLGGDEFALIIERPNIDDAIASFLDRLNKELARSYDISGSMVNCSASIGVRPFKKDGTKTSVLIKHADLALYHAKEEGRGRWSMFEQSMEDTARERREIEHDLGKALERSELRLHFQPLVDATTRELVSCETLLRWQHPVRGLTFPGEFIEYAEDCGLITRLGDWVIRAALQEAARLPEHVRIGINISPLQIHSASLMTTIFNAIVKNKIDPSRVELEITESVLMNNTEFTIERLHKLREMGFRIALDDFGTGFSSLSYLHSFPFDKIKIDKSFVAELEHNEDSRKITVATLNLAKSLGLKCTAEGVETLAQADFLRDHGCDELQGYYFGKPEPLEYLSSMTDVKDASRTQLNNTSPEVNDEVQTA